MPHRRLWRRLGHKGTFLALFGTAFAVLGYAYLAQPVPGRTHESLAAATRLLPLQVWGGVWLAVGITGITAALTRRHPAGFAALVFMPVVWAVFYLAGWVAGLSPRGWISALVFGLIGGAVATVSGLVEPPPRAR